MNKVELLAPAGDLEKLKMAIIYGADAVYFGGEDFSLRAGAGGLSPEEMREGLEFAHDRGKRCYLTLNIFPHNEDIEPLKNYLNKIKDLNLDGILVSDPGVFLMVKNTLPDVEIHLSTQANMTNYETAQFWRTMGMKRLVLARELSLNEITEIRNNLPEDTELEAFVHGAMCISYSGRCLLSNFMTDRDSNRGMCAHPCRYKYVLEEEKRPGEYFPIEEDDRGTYIMNSNDLCMIEFIPELIEAGIASLKIEGRMKTVYYVASTIKAYREAIDSYYDDPDNWKFKPEWMEELSKASHRNYTTGFYFKAPTNEDQNYTSSGYVKEYKFLGVFKEYDEDSGYGLLEQRNKFSVGDEVEIFGPTGDAIKQTIDEIIDYETGESVDSAPHPKQLVKIRTKSPISEYFIMRRKEEENVI